ncbi:hypothetical protein FOL47_003664 [Perkinsus chesapeaki]|uniref:subtilisin n=1 Tax=Perkinsus chesapeaki TaxID=330153 RepID=A0A7J6M6R8_PERCH|nr:hypothetical protein FOL47_003664 [Perkinsus chesapeaki]
MFILSIFLFALHAGATDSSSDTSLHVNDPDAHYQRHLEWLQMGEVWRISRPYVRRKVKVAVLDSGIDWTDEDFASLKETVKKKSGGYLDGGWNFFTNSPDMTTVNRHGTNVCKILAAKGNNSYGMVGVAPDVTLIPLQVIDYDGTVSFPYFLAAIEMAIDLEVDVVSMSFAFTLSRYNQTEQHLLWNALLTAQQHGILLVSSAGNEMTRASDLYPCWFGGPLGICVAYLEDNRTHNVLRSFSNWGERVDVATYGTNIFTGRDAAGELTYSNGSSYATPIIAGVAAILLSMDVEVKMIKRLMLANVKPVSCLFPHLLPQTIRGGALDPLSTIKHAISLIKPRSLRSTSEVGFGE